MKLLRVKSSNVKAIGYDAGDDDKGLLCVEFVSGAAYRYRDVPPALYEALAAAPSPGSFVARFVRPLHGERLTAEELLAMQPEPEPLS
jgi:hypothetical protein